MSEDSGAIFQVGDEVIWWKQIPGGDYAYPVLATVLKITAKRVQIEGDDDGRIVKRYVVAANLERPGVSPPAHQFTVKQGQYLAFIYNYTAINGRPPSEADMQRYFRTAPPNVHDMILRLEQGGWIESRPGSFDPCARCARSVVGSQTIASQT